MTDVVLAGAGHSQLAVLRELINRPLKDCTVTLINPSRYVYYSGMLPGMMMGLHEHDELGIDVKALADKAGVDVVFDEVRGFSATERTVTLATGRSLPFTVMSLATGSVIDAKHVSPPGATVVPVRPINQFIETWPELAGRVHHSTMTRIAVVGGGPGGVELSLAAATALPRDRTRVTLITGDPGLLPAFHRGVQRIVADALEEAGVQVVLAHARATDDGLRAGDTIVQADVVLAASGAVPPEWLATSGLVLGADGFPRVDACGVCIGHSNILASGDVASWENPNIRRSGVHAVRAGEVLAHNVVATVKGTRLRPYNPPSRTLAILTTGYGRAVASWGSAHAQGRWAWQLKEHLDHRYVERNRP